MPTVIRSIELSSEDSITLQRWVREAGLSNIHGIPWSLRKACEFIIADFAQVLRSSDEELDEDERLRKLVAEVSSRG